MVDILSKPGATKPSLPPSPPPPPNKCEERSQKPKQTQTKMQQGVLSN